MSVKASCPPLHSELIQCAWTPVGTYVSLKGYVVNRWFAIRQADKSLECFEGWKVIHRPSGYSAATVRTKREAVACAKSLTRCYPAKRWNFKTPAAARGLTKAKAVVDRYMERTRWP